MFLFAGSSRISTTGGLKYIVPVSYAILNQFQKKGGDLLDYRVQKDETLVERLWHRDPQALEALYDRYADLAFATAARMLGRDLAEDIVQESFMKLWRDPKSYQTERGAFSSWFLSTVHHRSVDELRKRRRIAASNASEQIELLLEKVPDSHPGPEEQVLEEHHQMALAEALKALPSEQREVLFLAYFDGLTQIQIAAKLQIPLGTVKTRVRLGLQKLKECLQARGITP